MQVGAKKQSIQRQDIPNFAASQSRQDELSLMGQDTSVGFARRALTRDAS